MATTQNLYTGNGSITNYSFTFEYLVQADVKATLDGTATTAFTFPNATTLAFSTAPANGVAIRIFRDTNIDAINATFFPGSAIKAEDLNNNFIQNNFATQETDTEVITANTTAGSAVTTANSAVTTANSAVSTANSAVTTANSAATTANTASTNASAAVTTANAANTKSDASVATANTASTNASAAVATANTASTNASAAVNTANTASTNATTAVNTANAATTTANGAVTTANAATATANTASTNASAAVTTANTASTNASAAVTTANTANTAAGNAVTTANTASTNATSAVTTANGAVTTANTADTNASAAVVTANAASAAISNAVLFTLVANVAAIPGSPSNNDYIEIGNSTGIESFSPLSGLPSGFVGASGLTVRLTFNSSASSWVFMNYFANDSEDRYFKKTGGTFTGDVSFDDNIIAKGDSTNGSGQITLNCEVNTHGVKIKGPPHSAGADYTLTLPNDDGNSNDLLKTDGNGALSWVTSSAANITNTASGNLAATNVQGALNELQGDIDSNVTNIAARLPLAGGTLTGDLTIPDKIIHSGDTNTFIRFPAADTFSVDTAGSERLRINSSGNVGINTSNPDYKLHAIEPTNDAVALFDSNNVNGAHIRFGKSAAIKHFIGCASGFGAGDADDLGYRAFDQHIWLQGSTELMRLNSTGNLGLGTSSPLKRLHVSASGSGIEEVQWLNNAQAVGANVGAALIFTGTTNNNGLAGISGCFEGAATTNGGYIKFDTRAQTSGALTERLRINSSGNVGIGTSSPVQKLHLNSTSVDVRLALTNSVSGATNSDGCQLQYNTSDLYINNAESGFIQLLTAGSPRMTINSSGNVGIGTSSPDFGLHLHSSSSYFKISNSGTGEGGSDGMLFGIDGTGNVDLWNYENKFIRFATNNTERMQITSSGSINFNSGTIQFGSTGAGLFSGLLTVSTSASSAGTNLQEWRSAYNSGNIVARIYASGGAVFNGSVTASNISDIRFKENLADAKPQLSDVVALGSQLKNWDWKDDAPLSAELRAKRFLGLVAQEAVKVCPDIAYDVPNTKDGKELTPKVVTPAVYRDEIVPAVVGEDGKIIKAKTTKKVLVTSEKTTPATYEQLDDSYKAINHDILVMKLLGAVAELSAKVAALEAAAD